nr:EOG090X09BG [Triops cancriformis]
MKTFLIPKYKFFTPQSVFLPQKYFSNAANASAVKTESSASKSSVSSEEENFRTLDLGIKKKPERRARTKNNGPNLPIPPPRYEKMSPDQDWGSVWPTARSFHPASVPLPVRQGFVPLGQAAPGKFGNAELMKIPNFLHLAPPIIQRQCEALKKFCNEWPKTLETEELMEKHFPVELSYSDFCHSSPTIRDARARIVSLKVKVKDLPLDERARDKFLRLVGHRYQEGRDELTIVAERCPLRKQNTDYALYVLNVLVAEARNVEPWESEKREEDMEKFVFDMSRSNVTVRETLSALRQIGVEIEKEQQTVKQYAQAVTQLHNDGIIKLRIF